MPSRWPYWIFCGVIVAKVDSVLLLLTHVCFYDRILPPRGHSQWEL